jgi:hypothetical protein
MALRKGVPERGRVGMLNHYEDSLVVRVHSQQALRADVEGTVEQIEELAEQIAEFASEPVIKESLRSWFASSQRAGLMQSCS